MAPVTTALLIYSTEFEGARNFENVGGLMTVKEKELSILCRCLIYSTIGYKRRKLCKEPLKDRNICEPLNIEPVDYI